MDAVFHTEDPNTYHDFTLTKRQYVYFKLFTNQADMPEGAGVRAPFDGIGIGLFKADGSPPDTINYLSNSFPAGYQEDHVYTSENVFSCTYSQTYDYEYDKFRGTLFDRWC